MATKRTTLAGMLADHDISPADAGNVGMGTLVDAHAQVAALGRLDPSNPALPSLHHALQHAPHQVPGMLGQVQSTKPAWRQWLPLILAVAGLVAAWWYFESRKKRRRSNTRRTDDETFEELDLEIED